MWGGKCRTEPARSDICFSAAFFPRTHPEMWSRPQWLLTKLQKEKKKCVLGFVFFISDFQGLNMSFFWHLEHREHRLKSRFHHQPFKWSFAVNQIHPPMTPPPHPFMFYRPFSMWTRPNRHRELQSERLQAPVWSLLLFFLRKCWDFSCMHGQVLLSFISSRFPTGSPTVCFN